MLLNLYHKRFIRRASLVTCLAIRLVTRLATRWPHLEPQLNLSTAFEAVVLMSWNY